jgi:hypothetical protein
MDILSILNFINEEKVRYPLVVSVFTIFIFGFIYEYFIKIHLQTRQKLAETLAQKKADYVGGFQSIGALEGMINTLHKENIKFKDDYKILNLKRLFDNINNQGSRLDNFY